MSHAAIFILLKTFYIPVKARPGEYGENRNPGWRFGVVWLVGGVVWTEFVDLVGLGGVIGTELADEVSTFFNRGDLELVTK